VLQVEQVVWSFKGNISTVKSVDNVSIEFELKSGFVDYQKKDVNI